MEREEKWLAFVHALQALTTTTTRPLRICVDCYFPTEDDFGALTVLFPYVEKIGLIVPSYDAATVYRQTLKSLGSDKVVPVVNGDQFSDGWDAAAWSPVVVNRILRASRRRVSTEVGGMKKGDEKREIITSGGQCSWR
jgi:hypothetical protein